MKRIIIPMIVATLFISCVERGKPIKEEAPAKTVKAPNKKVDHYICTNGHAGADKQGTCTSCGNVLQHNQLYHGNGKLALPQQQMQDPFNAGAATNNTPAPAQNAFGVYHYVCPNGHSGGSGGPTKCVTCSATLAHNQPYHK